MTITFKQFVNSMSAEREIDHTNWKSCALGEYVFTRRSKEEQQRFDDQLVPMLIPEIAETFLEGDYLLTASLNYGGFVMYISEYNHHGINLMPTFWGGEVFNTYGDLQAYFRNELQLAEDPDDVDKFLKGMNEQRT